MDLGEKADCNYGVGKNKVSLKYINLFQNKEQFKAFMVEVYSLFVL